MNFDEEEMLPDYKQLQFFGQILVVIGQTIISISSIYIERQRVLDVDGSDQNYFK